MSNSREIAPPNDDEIRAENETVDPYLRAHVHSLVAALGGPSPVKGGGYILGDEAQYVLRDLKKWLRAYDEKLNRLDVARCLAEAKLVGGDLVEILASWPEDKIDDRRWYRLALSCLELLVPLTWPIERKAEMTVNHHRHISYLEYAQAGYKRVILHHRSKKVLMNCIKIALPALYLPMKERESRDESIIRLTLYFIRNLAAIHHPNPTEKDTGEDIGRNATIKAFDRDNVLHLLLMISSGMGDEFNAQDVPVMEILFHLLKGVDMKTLFMSEANVEAKERDDLASLLASEKGMEILKNRDGPTRHNRFGTQLWVSRGDGKMSTISGQDALASKEKGLQKMDGYKKWNKPQGGKKQAPEDIDVTVHLSSSGRKLLREFVENFIDSGFNPLFHHIRKDIDREAERFVSVHIKVFFYLVAWLLEAERMRRAAALKDNPQEVPDSFSIIAAVMNQETLILIQRHMRQWWENKMWPELESVMKCFTQILLTVQDMAVSPFEEDQDIAENIQSRIFYEESTLDLVHTILRGYTTQTFGYLNTVTEMVHVHTKMLERYSKQSTQIFVRAKQAKSKKKQQDKDKNADSDAELQAENKSRLKEKAFDFGRFEARLLNASSIDAFVKFLGYYKELDYEQMKRALSYFHRVFVKRKMEVVLYRLDIVELFYRIMQDKEGLPTTHPAYKEMDQFTRHFIKQLVRKLQSTPTLYVELLFTKSPKTFHYLQFGYDKEVTATRAAKAAAEFQVKGNMSHSEQIGVTIAALIDEEHKDLVLWIKDILTSAAKERRLWETEHEARKLEKAAENPAGADNDAAKEPAESELPPIISIPFDTEERKKLLFKNAKLRLLCTLVGAEIQGERDDVDSAWILPNHLTASKIEEHLKLFEKYLTTRIELPEGQSPSDLIKRKPAPRKTQYTTSSDESDPGSDDNDFIVDDNGERIPGPGRSRRDSGSVEGKEKKKGKKRVKRGSNEIEAEIDARLAEERKEQRLKQKELEIRKIKSSVYVHSSDEEWDTEEMRKFFEREKAMLQKVSLINTAGREERDAVRSIYEKRKEKEEKKLLNSDRDDDDGNKDEDAMELDDEMEKPKKKKKPTKKVTPKRKRTPQSLPSGSEEEAILSDGDMTDDGSEADSEDDPRPKSKKKTKKAPKKPTKKPTPKSKARKRRTPTPVDLDDEDEEMEDVSPPKKRMRASIAKMVELSESEDEDAMQARNGGYEDHDMDISEPVVANERDGDEEEDDDEDDVPLLQTSQKSARARAAAMLLSDEEEELQVRDGGEEGHDMDISESVVANEKDGDEEEEDDDDDVPLLQTSQKSARARAAAMLLSDDEDDE